MRIPHSAQPTLRLGVLIAFVSTCALVFGYLWVNMGGSIVAVTHDGYRVTVTAPDVDNMVYDSDVRVAGVTVGKVRDFKIKNGKARVLIQMDKSVVPLHQGAKIYLRAKSLVEETYLEVVDGKGATIPNGATLPTDTVQASVQLHEVLTSLDAPTRKSLGSVVRSLGDGTVGSKEDISRTMDGLGKLGGQGHDVLDALAAQSEDLKAMTKQTTVLLNTLDTRRGQIVSLVEDANRLTKATAGSNDELAQTMKQLPDVLQNAKGASSSLTQLSGALTPVAASLAKAAPDLNKALLPLPAVTNDLKSLMPALNGTLDRAPATLKRVPAVAKDGQALVPSLRVALSDVNPMLSFLSPYGKDLAAFFTNWTAMLANSDVNGHYVRVMTVFNEQSLSNLPLNTNIGPLNKSNAYPAPGESVSPGPFSGTYKRVEKDKK